MTFPVYLQLGPLRLAPHQPLELLGGFLGFRVYLALRRRQGDPLPLERRLPLLAAAIVGAALGSKLLAWLNDPAPVLAQAAGLPLLLSGKTIVGGLLGGLLAVELLKWRLGEGTATGDLYVFPLLVGIGIGRIGCFLTGLSDDTYGNATTLPWGIDFGDGVARHPTQLYEIFFLLALAAVLWRLQRRLPARGDLFKLFMAAYLGWRLLIDGIKPAHLTLLGLTPIQLACALGLCWYAPHLLRIVRALLRSSPATPAAA